MAGMSAAIIRRQSELARSIKVLEEKVEQLELKLNAKQEG